MIVDTTVLIDLTRNNDEAHKFLLTHPSNITISRISLMEVIDGLQTKRVIPILKRQLVNLNIQIIEIDQRISEMAGEVFEKYHHSNGLGMMDALIAATSVVVHEKLATHNMKHFRFIKELEVVKPY